MRERTCPLPLWGRELMLIRIIKENPGAVFGVGQLIKVGDKQGLDIIEQGWGAQADEIEIARPAIPAMGRKEPPKARGANPFMMPPRHLCGCGWVAKTEEELTEHMKDCP